MSKINSNMTDQQYFELLCQRIFDASVNIAHTYEEYLRFAFVCSMFGDVGREWFHRICALDAIILQLKINKFLKIKIN